MSEKKLNVCHIITRMIVGGAQENTLLTILGHLEKGHRVTLLTGPSTGPEGKLLEKHKDLPPFEVVETPRLVRELSPIDDVAAYFYIRKFLRERKFDVAHTHSSKAGIIGRAAARSAGVPAVIHTIHGQAFHPYEKPWRNRLYIFSERWAAKRCDRILSVAQAMIDQCVAAGIAAPELYQVVYSGMELGPFLNSAPDPELAARLGLPAGAPVIGAVARLFPLKGYEYFVPAAARIAAKRPDAHFLIVGDGVMRADLEKQIAELGLKDRFSFAGLVPPNEVPRYIALMTVMSHLSLREGLPRVVAQAFACGKPAVTFALDGAPEIVRNDQTGYTVPPGDTAAAADAVLKILDTPDLAKTMGANGRELVRTRFDWRYMADQIEAAYYRVLEKRV